MVPKKELKRNPLFMSELVLCLSMISPRGREMLVVGTATQPSPGKTLQGTVGDVSHRFEQGVFSGRSPVKRMSQTT